MIKVFHIGAIHIDGKKIMSKDNGYFAVCADKPNVLSAIDMAYEEANEYVCNECSLFDVQENEQCRGEYVLCYPLDCGFGVPLQDAKAMNLPITNEDDLYSFEYELNDLDKDVRDDVIERYVDVIAGPNDDWYENVLYKFIEKAKSKYHFDVQYNDISFSLGYVQGDFACFAGECKDPLAFLDAIYSFDSASHRRLFKYLAQNGYVNIFAERQQDSTHIDMNYDYPCRLNDKAKMIEEMMDDIYSLLKDFAYNADSDLYWDIRNEYECLTSEESVVDYIADNYFTFNYDGSDF